VGWVRKFSLAVLRRILRADSEQQVESAVWKASSNQSAELGGVLVCRITATEIFNLIDVLMAS
jgi:hypothetical protein